MANAGEFYGPGYLAWNEDVAAAGVDAFEHFKNHGYKEGRVLAVKNA